MPSLCLRTGDSLTDNERDHQGFCLIAAPAVDPALLLRPFAGAKRKPSLGVERQLGGWAWVQAATHGPGSVGPCGGASSFRDALVWATVSWRPQSAS